MNVWIYGNAAKNGAKLFRLKPGDNWVSGSTASFQTRGIMSRGGGGGYQKVQGLGYQPVQGRTQESWWRI